MMQHTKKAIEDNISRCKNKKIILQLEIERLMGQIKENEVNQLQFEDLLERYIDEFEKEKESANAYKRL